MPSTTSLIGPLTLPVPAGAANARIADPAIDGLLSFFAFWIKNEIDAKLATLSSVSHDAVPTANRYPWDPTSPRAPRVKVLIPALFLWWDGDSTTVPHSTVYSFRRRTLGLLYAFDELSTTDMLDRCDGLLAAVDGALAKASERGRHPSYSYKGAPLGTPIAVSLGGLDNFKFEYTKGAVGRFGIDTSSGGGRSSKRDRGNSDAGRDYPALRGTVLVQERIGLDTPIDPDDVAGDYNVHIETNEQGDPNDMIEILNGYAPGPDGSELDE